MRPNKEKWRDGARFFTENKVKIVRRYSDPDDIGPTVSYSEEGGA